MSDFSTLLVGGVPFILVVFGLVEFIKILGLKGNILIVVSLIIGLLLGIAYKLSLGMPVDFASWLAVVFFGLAIGLTASGVYSFLDDRFPRLKG
jgi:hypothetical protein